MTKKKNNKKINVISDYMDLFFDFFDFLINDLPSQIIDRFSSEKNDFLYEIALLKICSITIRTRKHNGQAK